MSNPNREAMGKVIRRLQNHSESTGKRMTHEQARQIVARSLERAENKSKHKNQG